MTNVKLTFPLSEQVEAPALAIVGEGLSVSITLGVEDALFGPSLTCATSLPDGTAAQPTLCLAEGGLTTNAVVFQSVQTLPSQATTDAAYKLQPC